MEIFLIADKGAILHCDSMCLKTVMQIIQRVLQRYQNWTSLVYDDRGRNAKACLQQLRRGT